MERPKNVNSGGLRLRGALYRFRESLFLLPTVLAAAGVVLSVVAAVLDQRWPRAGQWPGLLGMSSNAATWLLSTVAAAMITTAGVVLSMTVVSLQLASQQFSPRVMRTFIRDRMSQSVIGMLVAAFFFCVLTLPRVSADPTAPAPAISMTVAVAMTLVTVLAIIAHLDHLARRLQVGHVVQSITDEAIAMTQAGSAVPPGLKAVATDDLAPTGAQAIPAARSGWVTAVDLEALLRRMSPQSTVRLDTRVGAYLHRGEPLLSVWPAQPDRISQSIAATIGISDARTMQQDVDFAIRQLVDIGLRALSSAINDPTTTVEVVLRLGTLLRLLLTTPLGPRAFSDDAGRVVWRPWDLDHDEYIAHAFDQIRQASPGQPAVAAALLRVLRMLIVHLEGIGDSSAIPVLRRQMRLTLEAARTTDWHPEDLARLEALMSDDTDPADHSRDR